MRITPILVALLSCFAPCISAFPQEPVAVLDAMHLNALGLRRFDVIMRLSSFSDNPSSGQGERTVYTRIVADLDAERCGQFSFGRHELRNANAKDVNDTQSFGNMVGVIIKANSAISRTWPDDLKRTTYVSFPDAMQKHSIYSFEFVGATSFPMLNARLFAGSGRENLREHSEPIWSFVRSQFATAKRMPGHSSPAFRAGPVRSSKDRAGVWTELVCDADTLLPVRRSMLAGGPGAEHPTVRMGNESIDWLEKGNVHVPTRISRDRRRSDLDADGKKVAFEENIHYDLHWLSVNAPLDASSFDESILSDLELFQTKIDPKLLDVSF